jgi:hypothetical protein
LNEPIGEAWMEEDGTLVLRLVRTADGIPAHALLRYPPSDPHHQQVLDHLGGLQPGQVKAVAPWPDPSENPSV